MWKAYFSWCVLLEREWRTYWHACLQFVFVCAACCPHSRGWFGFYYVTSRGCVQGPALWRRLPCGCLEISGVLNTPQLQRVRVALTELKQVPLISTCEIVADHQSGHSKALEQNLSTGFKDLCCGRWLMYSVCTDITLVEMSQLITASTVCKLPDKRGFHGALTEIRIDLFTNFQLILFISRCKWQDYRKQVGLSDIGPGFNICIITTWVKQKHSREAIGSITCI